MVDLWEAGWQVSVNTVAAIMAEPGWVARPKRVGDVTLIRTPEGPLCAATVIDLFARRMLDLATSTHHDAGQSCRAL